MLINGVQKTPPPLLLLYEIVHEVHKKKEGRKKLNYDVQTYSISATISNGQKSDGSRSTMVSDRD